MKCCISHNTAIRWLTSNANQRLDAQRPCRVSLSAMSVPQAVQARSISDFLWLNGNEPLDVLVAPDARRDIQGVRCHTCAHPLPSASFVPIPSPLPDLDLYVVSPELAFVQQAFSADLQSSVYCGMALCSEYRSDSATGSGVTLRQFDDAPLTSPARLAAYLDRLQSVPGASRAAQALPFVRGKSRSPKESGLAMTFGLPLRFGGFHLGEVALNERIDIVNGKDEAGNPRLTTRYPDLTITNHDRCGRKRTVAIDYDGFSLHTDPHAMARDNRRRNEIATVEKLDQHFTLTTDDVSDFRYLDSFADRVRKSLGQRKQPYLKGNPDSADNVQRKEAVWQKQYELWARFVSGRQEY